MSCPDCQAIHSSDAPFCKSCGMQLPGLGSRAMSAAVRERLLRCHAAGVEHALQWSECIETRPGAWQLRAARR